VISRRSFAVIIAVASFGVLWIEHGHRISIDAPIPAAMASPDPAVCPNNDSVPYPTGCLAFMAGSGSNRDRVIQPAKTLRGALAFTQQDTELGSASSGGACPDNDNAPYTARCITFLTGWFWRPVE
jgi:hypothetical protein